MASKKTTRSLIGFFLHLSQMEKAGVPLRQSLQSVADDEELPALRKKWQKMLQTVQGGYKLHEAMALYPRLFDDAVRGLVAAGEETGKLSRVLASCQDYYSRADTHRRQMRRATLQPKIAAVVISGMAFIRRHSALPKLAAGILLAGAVLVFARRFVPGMRYLTDRVFLMAAGPVRRFTLQYSYACFADALAMVYTAGIPLRRGLAIAAGVVPNLVVRADIESAIPRVTAGQSLHKAFSQCRFADPLALSMLKAGEDSGNLGTTLSHVAEYYNKETDDSLTALQQTMGPVLTILLGLMLYKSL
jgi:type II secretory pathway component PulF